MTDGTHLIATACHSRQNGQHVTPEVLAALTDYLDRLHADLEAEIDLHGGRTVMAYNLRQLITQTRKELEELTH